MKILNRYIASHTLKPLISRYLKKQRVFHYRGLKLLIPPGVFHPRFFFTSTLLASYVRVQPIKNKTVLDLGCGSGIIGLHAAQLGAIVTVSDISSLAVETVVKNAAANALQVTGFVSDLFETVQGRQFDFIFVNPPFYEADPLTIADHAWYCGSDSTYFSRFFHSLSSVIHQQSVVVMILSEHCNLERIRQHAAGAGFMMTETLRKKNWIETNFIFHIQPIPHIL